MTHSGASRIHEAPCLIYLVLEEQLFHPDQLLVNRAAVSASPETAG